MSLLSSRGDALRKLSPGGLEVLRERIGGSEQRTAYRMSTDDREGDEWTDEWFTPGMFWTNDLPEPPGDDGPCAKVNCDGMCVELEFLISSIVLANQALAGYAEALENCDNINTGSPRIYAALGIQCRAIEAMIKELKDALKKYMDRLVEVCNIIADCCPDGCDG